jgi:hypothetical protein
MYLDTKIYLPFILTTHNTDRKKYLFFFHKKILDKLSRRASAAWVQALAPQCPA